ncbi:TPA: hypothetical protein SMF67_000839 [Serratia marcescens]|uniref:hypothetical protein n=1 Tax=Serratia marcescens TaxID=615 RepID=UPI0013D90072|nr:hypothetical protein [Serratia marcescens]MDU7467387.1 hypothetical protein [Serratia marcescens]HEJ7090213.1 hypothetical protein [Serratia marcescens]
MTPEEIRLIVSEILPRIEITQPYSIGIVGVWGLFGGGVGAFFGAYLKRYGENKANDAHFKNLNEQLKINTSDTEEIKAAVSGHGWVRQQNWSIREKYYTALISSLSDWINEVSILRDYYPDPHCDKVEVEYKDRVAMIESRMSDACQKVRELRGPSLIFLTKKTNKAIRSIFRMLFNNSRDLSNHHDALNRTFVGLVKYRDVILKEAKKDLHAPLHSVEKR